MEIAGNTVMNDILNCRQRMVVSLTKINTKAKLSMTYLKDTGQFQLEVLSMQSEMSKWS